MTKMIFVDTEASGGLSPFSGVLTEFGAVELLSRESFHGVLWDSEPSAENPAVPVITNDTPHDHIKVMTDFEKWLKSFNDRIVFVSDNPAYDFMWIAFEFDRALGYNPFGHSGRRIGDLYAGLSGNWRNTSKWKKWRVTPHDHNPVNDAMGNVEAFHRMAEEFGFSLS